MAERSGMLTMLQHVHPGGYFQRIDRAAREAVILQAATSVRQIVVIARTDATARDIGERLPMTLS